MVTLRLVSAIAGRACESCTCTMKAEVPDAVGVPAIAPVLLFRVTPAGKLPEITLQVYGGMPPLAESVAL